MAAKKKAEKTENKSAFVRGLPASLSAKEVVAEGKKKGMKLTEAYVYKVRSGAKKAAGGKPASKAGSAKASKGSSGKAGAGGKQTATAFVRALPAGTSAKEAVAKAKAAGIPLTEGYFYTLRSSLGIAGGGKGKKAAPGKAASGGKGTTVKTTKGSAGLRITSNNVHEQSIIDAVIALGIDRARGVFDAAARFAR